MKRLAILFVALLAAAVAASAALAANGHWVSGPNVSVSNNTLTISGKAAGLGNTVNSTDFSLNGTVDVNSRCYTKSNNTPQADNKQESINVDQDNVPFAVRNGSVNVLFTITPLSTLSCPRGQRVVVESLSYDLNLTNDTFPALNAHLTSS